MTMHNHAEVGEISERIVLVGDPNRAKYIAEHYLEDAVLVNDVARHMKKSSASPAA